MLNPIAFASSLAQFLGADVASFLPRELTATVFLATLIALVVSAWALGLLQRPALRAATPLGEKTYVQGP
jgi:hypothetical protein